MKMSSGLSPIQKVKFKEMSGYEHNDESTSGEFETDRPYDEDDWEYSPWIFSFTFEQESGYLFCQLEHRMTNNRVMGWDAAGNEIDRAIVEKIYPTYLT